MVCSVYATGVESSVTDDRCSAPTVDGTMSCNPLVLAPGVTVKVKVFADHVVPENVELFRPSTHFSICFAETMGMARASAAEMIASAPVETAWSVCMLAV